MHTALTFMIYAHPPDHKWKYGRNNATILQVNEGYSWPLSGLAGMSHLLYQIATLTTWQRACCCPNLTHHVSCLAQGDKTLILGAGTHLCATI